MKKLLRILNFLIASVLVCFSVMATAEVIRFNHIANEGNVWHKAAIKFAKLTKKHSNGRLTVEIYPNSQLGTERETIEGIPIGLADMTLTGDSLSAWVPEVSVISQAFLFKDNQHVITFMNSSIWNDISKKIEQINKLKILTYFLRGPRYLTTNVPIRSVKDVKGLKIRVPNVPLFVNNWKAVGAQPTPMAFSEVFGAIQQGVVDGQENPMALIKSARFYEVVKYLNETAHVRQPIFLAIGIDKFNALPKADQWAILRAAKQTQAYERNLFNKDEANLVSFLKSKGMVFVKTDLSGFQEKTANIFQQVYPQYTDILNKVQAMAK